MQRRQTRLEKIRQAKQALEQRAKQRAQQQAAAAGRCDELARQAEPRDKDQYNFTDPESRIMKSGAGSCRATTTGGGRERGAIGGQTLTEAANDKEQLAPLVEAVERQSGQRPDEVLAKRLLFGEELGIVEAPEKPEQKMVPPRDTGADNGRRRRGGGSRATSRESSGSQVTDRELRASQRWRIFGQIKQARGIRQFLLRGLKKVRGSGPWCA